MVRGAAGGFRTTPANPNAAKFSSSMKTSTTRTWIVSRHIVVEAVGQQCYLTTVTTFDKSPHHNLQNFVLDSIKQPAFSHSLHPSRLATQRMPADRDNPAIRRGINRRRTRAPRSAGVISAHLADADVAGVGRHQRPGRPSAAPEALPPAPPPRRASRTRFGAGRMTGMRWWMVVAAHSAGR